MKRYCFSFFAVFVLGLILAACAVPPTDEMNKAQDAVIRAENDADAVTYAPNTLIHARDALTRMQSEADAKRYDEAKRFAAEAVSGAEKAIADGKTGAERTRQEAANLIAGLEGPLAETARALDLAWEVENIQLDFGALMQDMDTARGTYDSAAQDLRANNYVDAVTKAETVRSVLAGINSAITGAAQATSRKK